MKAFKMLAFAIALLVSTNAQAAVRQCKVIASGTFTETVTSSVVAIQPTAKNLFYVTKITAGSGSVTAQYKQSINGTNFSNTQSSGALTGASYTVNGHATSNIFQPAFAYQQVTLTISGESATFTLEASVCYEF